MLYFAIWSIASSRPVSYTHLKTVISGNKSLSRLAVNDNAVNLALCKSENSVDVYKRQVQMLYSLIRA